MQSSWKRLQSQRLANLTERFESVSISRKSDRSRLPFRHLQNDRPSFTKYVRHYTAQDKRQHSLSYCSMPHGIDEMKWKEASHTARINPGARRKPSNRRHFLSWLLLSLLVFLLPPAWGYQAEQTPLEYARTLWRVSNGLPEN